MPLGLNDIICATTFASPIKELIHYYKYDYVQAAAALLAELIVRRLGHYRLPPDLLLIPVPLHRRRLRERGFNQSELIARHLGQRLAWMVADGVLERRRYTSQQAKLNRQQRLLNLTAAFNVTKPELIAGRHIVLLDDVLTTGATLTACAAALAAAQPQSITGLCVAYDQLE